jgi:Glycosyl hydrolase family 9
MQAQLSGPLAGTNVSADLPWRADSAMSDSPIGGFYDSGDSFVKYSYPIASSMGILAWSLIEFPEVGLLRQVLH